MYPDLFRKMKINHWVRDRVREREIERERERERERSLLRERELY